MNYRGLKCIVLSGVLVVTAGNAAEQLCSAGGLKIVKLARPADYFAQYPCGRDIDLATVVVRVLFGADGRVVSSAVVKTVSMPTDLASCAETIAMAVVSNASAVTKNLPCETRLPIRIENLRAARPGNTSEHRTAA